MRFAAFALAALCAVGLAACGTANGSPKNAATSAASFAPSALPAGEQGALIRYGHDIIEHTRTLMRGNVVANMDCSACHVGAGTVPHGGSFVGIAAQFPQWNKRASRIITLQDRLAECFLYSMNGHPPAYSSREMIALVAYITYLSRGAAIGATPDPRVKLATISLGTPNVQNGARTYTQKCSMCHGANGAGSEVFPPLWGPTSFNGGAGMHRVTTMAGFVRYNMPQNAPGSLSDQEAYDVSAYVLSHARPKFQRNRLVVFPPQPAKFF